MQWVLQIHYTVNVCVLCETWEWRLPFWEDCVRSSIRNHSNLEQKHGWDMTFKSVGKTPFIVSSAKYWWSLTLPSSRRLKQPQTSSQTFPAMTVLICSSDPRLRRVKGSSSILGDVSIETDFQHQTWGDFGHWWLCLPSWTSLWHFSSLGGWHIFSILAPAVQFEPRLYFHQGVVGIEPVPHDTSRAHMHEELWIWRSRYSLPYPYSLL